MKPDTNGHNKLNIITSSKKHEIVQFGTVAG